MRQCKKEDDAQERSPHSRSHTQIALGRLCSPNEVRFFVSFCAPFLSVLFQAYFPALETAIIQSNLRCQLWFYNEQWHHFELRWRD